MKATAVLLAFLLILNPACTSVRRVPPHEIKGSKDRIYGVIYRNGTVVSFRPIASPSQEYGDPGYAIYGYYVWQTRSVEGVTSHGEELSVPVDSLAAVQVRRFNTKRVFIVSVVGVAALYAAAYISLATNGY